MASTNKTPRLGLNQWAAGDEVLRADFNGDNLKIDEGVAAVAALAEKSRVVTGSYVGDGIVGREIYLGFSPRFFFLHFVADSPRGTLIFAFPGVAMVVSNGENGILVNSEVCVTPTGFKINSWSCGNPNANTVRYLAIR